MGDGCRKCVRVTFMLFNFMFFLVGGAAIGLGAWVLVNNEKLIELIDLDTATIDISALLQRGAYGFIAAGSLIFLLSLVGFVGACKQSKCLLVLYGVCVLILVLVQLAAVVLAVVFKDKIEGELISYLNSTLVNFYEGNVDSQEPFSVLWDGYQISSQCCGIINQDDFLYTTKMDRSIPVPNSSVPFSCCKFEDTSFYPDNIDKLVPLDWNCTVNPQESNVWINKGCFNSMKSELGQAANVVIIAGAVMLCLQIIGVVLAFCVCRNVQKSFKVV